MGGWAAGPQPAQGRAGRRTARGDVRCRAQPAHDRGGVAALLRSIRGTDAGGYSRADRPYAQTDLPAAENWIFQGEQSNFEAFTNFQFGILP